MSLTKKDKAALRWAAAKADQWYGNITGDDLLENEHLQMMDRVQDALLKLGIRLRSRWQKRASGRPYMRVWKREP